MATKQDLKAKALKELEEEQRRLEEQRKKAAEKAAAQARKNKEADLPGYTPQKANAPQVSAAEPPKQSSSMSKEEVFDMLGIGTGKQKNGKVVKSYNAPNREGSYAESRENLLGENIVNVLGGMDEQLRTAKYDNALDNQAASMIGEFVYSPGAIVANYAKAGGEVLKADDKQYISPAAAARYNIGGNIGERAGADETKEFTMGETVSEEAPGWRKELGERITEAYEDNAALAYKENADAQRSTAMEQTESTGGKIALGLARTVLFKVFTK